MSEDLIDKHMCTEICPCKTYPEAQESYQMLDSLGQLQSRGRTYASGEDQSLVPFTWAEDGFDSFIECMEHWIDSDASY